MDLEKQTHQKISDLTQQLAKANDHQEFDSVQYIWGSALLAPKILPLVYFYHCVNASLQCLFHRFLFHLMVLVSIRNTASRQTFSQ